MGAEDDNLVRTFRVAETRPLHDKVDRFHPVHVVGLPLDGVADADKLALDAGDGSVEGARFAHVARADQAGEMFDMGAQARGQRGEVGIRNG
jgi:hypothetical protein